MRTIRIISFGILFNTGVLSSIIACNQPAPDALVIYTIINGVVTLATQIVSFLGACDGD